MRSLNTYIKILIIFILILNVQFVNAQTVGYPTVFEGITHTSGSFNYEFPGTIISPYHSTSSVNISGTAKVNYKAGHSIELNPGFTAGAFSGGGYYFAEINKPIDVALISPDASQVIDGVVHVKKWEKLEIGITLPQEYKTAIDNFFSHYYSHGYANSVFIGQPFPSGTDPNDGTDYYGPTSQLIDKCHDLNPFADDSLIVKMILTSPSGMQIEKYGFFYREAAFNQPHIYNPFDANAYALGEDLTNPLSRYYFRFRFAPNEVDANIPWQFTISISVNPVNYLSCSPAPNFLPYTFSGFKFICDPPLPQNKGFVKVNSDNTQYLQFSNGDPFFPIGENLSGGHNDCALGINDPTHGLHPDWSGSFPIYNPLQIDFENTKNIIDELSSAGANYVRLWLGKDNFNVEYHNLGVYDQFYSPPRCDNEPTNWGTWRGNSQYTCWLLDQVFNQMHDKGMYAQIVVDPTYPKKGGMSWDWGDYAYVKYLASVGNHRYDNTLEYLTNANLRYFWKRKYKYILSRWGYSTNLAVIETFNEIDQLLGFAPEQNAGGLCYPDYSTINTGTDAYTHQYVFSPSEIDAVRGALEDWHIDILGYAKSIDENKHLHSVSFTDGGLNDYHIQWQISCPPYNNVGQFVYDSNDPLQFADYHRLFYLTYPSDGTPVIDISDIHTYIDGHGGPNLYYFPLAEYTIHKLRTMGPTNKPYRMGEFDTFGVAQSPVSSDEFSSHYYNNHELMFHNNIWGTAMIGGLGMGLPWFGHLIHRLPYMTHSFEPDNTSCTLAHPIPYQNFKLLSLGDNFPMPGNPGVTLNAHYNDYNPLVLFTNNIDFNKKFEPLGAFPGQGINTCLNCNNIESYYLVETNSDPQLDKRKANGWVHYTQKYWKNSYYFDNSFYHLECSDYGTGPGSTPILASTDKIIMEGFKPSHNYWIKFFETRSGQQSSLPVQVQCNSDANGRITLTQSSPTNLNLACDKFHSDYAFIISDNQNDFRIDTVRREIDFEIIPNPTFNNFTVTLPGNVNETCEVSIYDIFGKVVLKKKRNAGETLAFNMADYESGVYFVKVKSGDEEKTKRLVLMH
jgi:hypothetical protein